MIYLTALSASPPDDRDYPYVPVADFPAQVNIRTGDVEDQGPIGSCTANSVVSACEAIKPGHLSRLHNYYHTRAEEGRLGQDGAVLRNAVRMAQKKGLPPESLWPYDVKKAEVAPPADVDAEAAKHLLTRYERIDLTGDRIARVNAIKSAVSEGFPVVFGMPITTQWMALSKATARTYMGGRMTFFPKAGNHAMTVVGYEPEFLHVENSWGAGWGDNGIAYLNVGHVEEIFEAWVIRGFDGADAPMTRPVGSNWAQAYRLYRAAFSRKPDAGGQVFWTAALDSGQTLLDVANFFIGSSEFQSLYGAALKNKEFMVTLYKNVLGREPDLGGLAYWLGRLVSGTTRAEVLVGFSESAENKTGAGW